MLIERNKVKCLGCKKDLYATVKIDPKTKKVLKYIEIVGGSRYISPLGYTGNYCLSCIEKLKASAISQTHSEIFVKGDVIKFLVKPEWGIGRIMGLIDDTVKAYFVNVGERSIKLKFDGKVFNNFEKVKGEERNQPIFKLLDLKYPREGHHNVYVIRLNAAVLGYWKFAAANTNCDRSKPCLYVGMTGLTPKERFENHKQDYKSAYCAHKYGEELLERFYKFLNPMDYENAKGVEIVLATLLHKQGFAVWQN
jgi:hypothetical protein